MRAGKWELGLREGNTRVPLPPLWVSVPVVWGNCRTVQSWYRDLLQSLLIYGVVRCALFTASLR